MKAALPQVKGEDQDPLAPRVQCGNPKCPHHHHIGIGEHLGVPDRPDGHSADRHAIARYGALPNQKQAY
jgi:hypothetical protein